MCSLNSINFFDNLSFRCLYFLSTSGVFCSNDGTVVKVRGHQNEYVSLSWDNK